MARYCVDASTLLAWLREAGLPDNDAFWQNLGSQDELHGAELLRAECTLVIRESVFTKVITANQESELLEKLLSTRLAINRSPQQFRRALELAAQFQTSRAYDMQYLAVAEIENAELVTLDRGLRHAAEGVGHPVRYLR